MAALFEAYITNLGKYNEGELVGEILKFPTSPQAVEALLKNIGVDGIRYEEFFITRFDGDVLELNDYLGEYENLDELNHLACLLLELPQGEIEKFEAALHIGTHTSRTSSTLRKIWTALNFTRIWKSEDDLGRYYAEDLPISAELKDYFDYEAYGLDRIARRMGAGFRQVFRSITVDNGSEFQDCAGMERSKRARKPRTKIYYCHPYSAYERGSNEHMNRIIRRFFPKGQALMK